MLSCCANPCLTLDALFVEISLELGNRPQFEVPAVKVVDEPGFLLVHHQLPLLHVIAKGHSATHPHSFTLRSRNLVPNPFSRHFSFELSEGKQNVESQTPHGGSGVELLGDGDEGNSARVESFNDLGKIGQAPRQAIDLVDNDGIDLSIFNVIQQTSKRWSVHASARISTVVVESREGCPSFLPWAGDEGLAGFSLGVERIEGHFQSFLGRLARVNGASHCPPRIGAHLASGGFGLLLDRRRAALTTGYR